MGLLTTCDNSMDCCRGASVPPASVASAWRWYGWPSTSGKIVGVVLSWPREASQPTALMAFTVRAVPTSLSSSETAAALDKKHRWKLRCLWCLCFPGSHNPKLCRALHSMVRLLQASLSRSGEAEDHQAATELNRQLGTRGTGQHEERLFMTRTLPGASPHTGSGQT